MKQFEDYKVAQNEHEMQQLLKEGWLVEHIYYESYIQREDVHGHFMGNNINLGQYVGLKQAKFIMRTRSTAHGVLYGETK